MTDTKPSKSERKRAQLELQALGEALAQLPDDVRQSLALDVRLEEALDDLQRMSAHGAIRRQKQFIGKLMRDVDAEPIRALLAARRAGEQDSRRLFARAERWRDRLARERHAALAAFEADVGARCTNVEHILDQLASAADERNERRLRRDLFREVHAKLVATATDG